MDAKCNAHPSGHPPVRLGQQAHERRHEQGAEDGGVEDDPRGEADRELLDLEAGTRGEHKEREHEDQRGAGHELAGTGEAELDRTFS
jgi:hypothetical protein